ncbi:(Fe-S)-binding protein [Agilicoccus flavus]|uniref:(Fe-S)-binding protein n=1 Tax=Agilicoccus flavus TaxID=2775968 RepID=UPI001CF6E1E5|nr:(Fe-S)-binding protein [Agilicoccus flavus]
MSALQITAIVVCLAVSTVGWLLLFRSVYRFVKVFRMGAADASRTDRPAERTRTLLREFFAHTRMARIPGVAVAHWFTALSFFLLFFTLVNAFLQLFDPSAALPLIGHFPPYEWLTELFAWAGLIGILYLIGVRQKAHPRGAAGESGRRSRFFGSTWWQAYYVEATILGVVVCVLALRALEYALAVRTGESTGSLLHFPLTAWMGAGLTGLSEGTLGGLIVLVATIKILISFAWMITISLTMTMGVAWHRFLAFPNIWFKRNADGRTALGALKPMQVNGVTVTAETLEEVMDDESGDLRMGAGVVEDFTWKNLLDFSTCTECGRCQSQCPAWNTDKPLSPKLLVMALRDHAHAKAPFVLAAQGAGTSGAGDAEVTDGTGRAEVAGGVVTLPLIGSTGYDGSPLAAYDPHGSDAVIDSDVLWSCTTCGACVEQCPVDIEHVDEILDMRRHQVLIESAFPTEFGGLFKNMENKGNPWGMAPKLRLDWAKGLDFEVPVVGGAGSAAVEDLSDVDYLFWVGCAGALEDRAKKTTRAVAELLNMAGVSFAVLGEGESCTGDSARRAGNEILFQMLAAQNVEVLNEAGATKIVVTCAHCFNALKNEYPQVGGQYEVLHHTQLLNRLVREKRLTPVARPDQRPGLSTAKDAASTAATVTYHDPCYLGRHNHVYAPPRELIGSLPGVTLTEMPRHGEKSFCCGAGGARMWAEEKLGTRINMNRTAEAVATGADRIAVGCPFCRVMLSDGLGAQQAQGEARDDVEVVDIAQMLLAAVRQGESPANDLTEAAAPPSAGESPAEVAAARATGDTQAPSGPPAQDSQAARGGSAEDSAPAAAASAPAPAAAAAPPAPAASGGTMSASDALAAMMGGAAAAPAQEKTAPVEASDTPSATPSATAPPDENGTQATDRPAAPTGKMSASDALAAMMGGSAPAPTQDATTDEAPAAAAPADDRPATPTGKMSASDALAAMTGGSAPAPTQDATTDDAPAAAAPADDRPATPTGKMSASDALAAMMGGAATAPIQDATTDEASDAQTPPAPAPAAPAPDAPATSATDRPATPTGRMSASDALAAMRGATAGSQEEAPTAPAAADTAEGTDRTDAAPAPAAPAAPSADRPATPTGRISASEALAAMMGGAGATTERTTESPAASTPQPASEPTSGPAPAAQPPAPSDAPAAGSSASTPVAPPATRDADPAPAQDRPASAGLAGAAPTLSRRMSASEALAAMMGGAAAPAGAPEKPASPGPASEPVRPEPSPADDAAATSAPAPTPVADPPSAAPTTAETPSETAAEDTASAHAAGPSDERGRPGAPDAPTPATPTRAPAEAQDTAPAPPRRAAATPPTAPARTMPTGRMSATDALVALLGGAAPAAPDAPAASEAPAPAPGTSTSESGPSRTDAAEQDAARAGTGPVDLVEPPTDAPPATTPPAPVEAAGHADTGDADTTGGTSSGPSGPAPAATGGRLPTATEALRRLQQGG